jgi:hypothetical protein
VRWLSRGKLLTRFFLIARLAQSFIYWP